MKSFRFIPLASLFFVSLAASSHAGISIYLSPNGIESAETSGITAVTTSTFTGTTPGYLGTYGSPIGTYVGDNRFIEENIYGGYQEGNYLGIFPGESTTLTLNDPVAYFGFYFSAGDAGNIVELMSGGNVILTFKTGDLINMLPKTIGSQIQAINGSLYNTLDYYGQPGPNNGATNNEPYAYVHFIGTAGTTFDAIRFSEPHTATFETDNHSIRTTAPTLPGTLVNITNVVPEPSGALLGVFSIGSLALLRRRA